MKKELIIKKSEEIEAVIKNKSSVSGENFIVYKKENHLPVGPRFALSVPKKFGIAVKRNLMKRRIRSVFDSLNIKKEYDVFDTSAYCELENQFLFEYQGTNYYLSCTNNNSEYFTKRFII